jgi:hypothetical protein
MAEISVILPTRLRLEMLKQSLTSLQSRASVELEFVLAVDEDDPTDYSSVGPFSPFDALVLRTERFGYERLHEYYNLLADRVSSRWILLWNDDALMVTSGWDQVVLSYEPDKVLSPHTVHDPLCTFPVIPRRFVDRIGHFSLNAHCDSWWQEVAEALGILRWVDIRVDHRRADVCGENNDSVFAERVYQTEEFTLQHPLRLQDAKKIRELLV